MLLRGEAGTQSPGHPDSMQEEGQCSGKELGPEQRPEIQIDSNSLLSGPGEQTITVNGFGHERTNNC